MQDPDGKLSRNFLRVKKRERKQMFEAGAGELAVAAIGGAVRRICCTLLPFCPFRRKWILFEGGARICVRPRIPSFSLPISGSHVFNGRRGAVQVVVPDMPSGRS